VQLENGIMVWKKLNIPSSKYSLEDVPYIRN
jgi:hypothetical protein